MTTVKIVTATLAMADAFGADVAKAAIEFAMNGGTGASPAPAAKPKGKGGRKKKVVGTPSPDGTPAPAGPPDEPVVCGHLENGVRDCTEPARSKGLCSKHYQTQRRADKKAAGEAPAPVATA